MRYKAFNFLYTVLIFILFLLILSQVSDILYKIGKKDVEQKQNVQSHTDQTSNYYTSNDFEAKLIREDKEEVQYETEHEEKGDDKESIFSPKRILSYQMPFLTQLDIETGSGVEQSIFIRDNDIVTKTTKIPPQDISIELNGSGPHILIYHTHTSEAYRKTENYDYEETTPWRSDDTDYNVVSIGRALKEELENKYGYSVLHDTCDHEPPKLSTSYSRSVITMEKHKSEHENLRVFIDIHRDAANVETDTDDVVIIDGKECARIMFVVGTGKNFNEKPLWESNYKLALAISNELNSIQEGFAKPIRVKDGRYNQHISDACMLIEVGHNANTHKQAMNSVEYIAKAISIYLMSNS